jgi:hypothetical protein
VALGVAVVSGLAAAGGCVSNEGLLVILQNQKPVADETTGICNAGMTASAALVGTGVLDLETSSPPAAAPAYIAYPLVQSTLPVRAANPGEFEPNMVSIEGVRGTIIPPPGLTMTWPDGCPANFYSPYTATLMPGAMLGLTAQVISPCQAKAIHVLFASGDLPSDLGQRVLFTIEMRAVGSMNGGGEIDSDAFRFSVRTCIGCLQTGSSIAQYNFPARPSCSAAPKPNPAHGNLCNPAQDEGPILCCTDDMNQIVCPAPDM